MFDAGGPEDRAARYHEQEFIGLRVQLAPVEVSASQFNLVVGRAWEASSEEGVKRTNTIVGVGDVSSAIVRELKDRAIRIANLETRMAELETAHLALELRPRRVETSRSISENAAISAR